MAAPVVNEILTYDIIGKRESLEGVIYDISPTETPVLTGAGRGDAKSTVFDWLQDALEAPDTTNAQLEGDQFSFESRAPRVRIGNVQQISTKRIVVSETSEAVEKAGVDSEMSYQIARAGKELKRDMEKILLSNQAANLGGEATARKTGTILSFLRTNTTFGAGGVDPAAPNPTPAGTRTDGTLRIFDEQVLKDLVYLGWASGMDVDGSTLMVPGKLKQTASGFEGIATQFKNADKKVKIVATADLYVSDYGEFSILPNRWMRNRDALLIDWKYLTVKYLRPFKTVNIAVTGDNKKKALVVEWGLHVGNEAGLALASDLKPAS